MKEQSTTRGKDGFWGIIGASAFVASLCCLTPLVLVMLGLSSVAFAGSLADTLYGSYKWAFRGAGLALLVIALTAYFRRRGVCTLDQARRRRNEIINKALIALIAFTLIYVVFLYVVVEYAGIWYGIWT